MIAEANRDIRCAMRVAEKAQRRRLTINRPFAYLDEVIVGLETLHLKGLTNVPQSFMPRLRAVRLVLPAEIDPPSQWRRRIARAIDQCFDLQERLRPHPRAGEGTWKFGMNMPRS